MGMKVILLVLTVVQCGVSLECYRCVDELNPASCNQTHRCSDGQLCGAHSNIQSSIVGRDIRTRQAASCFECCSKDQCNKHLCQHPRPSACTDDVSIDCAKLNTLFSICTDIDHAKKVCPNFCGLCSVIDGNWSAWSEWSQCDVTCENGTQTRTRLCNNPSPENGGSDCFGNNMLTRTCSRGLCPVHGGWSTWEAWMSCSTSCDIGLQSRTRNCSNPVPERNGKYCLGYNLDVRHCKPGPCANGGWSDLGSWNSCSVTCGVGVQSKLRSCTNPPPSPYGQYCIGEHSQVEFCTRPDCVLADCYDIMKMNLGRRSGVYLIKLWQSGKELEVFCDLETDNGGWTVFQRRFNGSLDCHRNFSDYTDGFGNVHGEFWLGLQTVYEMASKGQSELRIDLEAADGTKAYETFQNFGWSSGPDYTLHISGGLGTAGDGKDDLSYNNGKTFSTYDHGPASYCASTENDYGGWWYYNCAYANLNGKYITPGTVSLKNSGEGGVTYYSFQGHKSLKQTKMMFRRIR